MPLTTASPADPRAVALMNAQQQELRALYQDTDERTEPFDPAILSGEGSVLLVWTEDHDGLGELLACGALKRWDSGSAEVKRMYTRPEARGRGLGREVLNGLILQGRQLGYERLLLETGDLQAEAIRLYETAGFTRIPNFGYYVGIDNSLCFELRL
jgi:putative acetyltransferase